MKSVSCVTADEKMSENAGVELTHLSVVVQGVKGGGNVGHWGGRMVDHQHGGSWLVREGWRQNRGDVRRLGVERVRRCPVRL